MKHIIRSFAILILLSLALTGCKYKDDDIDNGDNWQKQNCPYGNYDYSLKPYFGYYSDLDVPIVYQNFAFFIGLSGKLVYVDLSDLKRDMSTYKRSNEEYEKNGKLGEKQYEVCNEEHTSVQSCPAAISFMVLDAYESAGSYPVFYSVGQDEDNTDPGSSHSVTYSLYKYDTGSNIRRKICDTNGKPLFMMSYGDYIYLSEAKSDDKYHIEAINKKTAEKTTLNLDGKRIQPIHADGDKVYFYEWLTGTLYVSDRKLAEYKPIFTPPEVYTVKVNEIGIGMFIDNGYIYFRADYEKRQVPIPQTEPVQYITPFVYNIKRVPLDNPGAESKLVAKDVFEGCDHGVYGNNFYFTAYDPKEQNNAYCYFNFNNGRLCKTDLTTMTTTDVLDDSGFFFEGVNNTYVNSRCILLCIRPVTEKGTFVTLGDAMIYLMLYDFETGQVYYISGGGGSAVVTPRN